MSLTIKKFTSLRICGIIYIMKIFVAVASFIMFLSINTSIVFAGYLYGPSGGTQVNGYYTSKPEVRFSNVTCSNGGTGTSVGPITLPIVEGVHSYNVYEVGSGGTSHGYFYTTDGGGLTSIGTCGGATGNYDNLAWSGQIKLDTVNPNLQVAFPTNNYNTTSSTITVTGTVSDVTSGISYVKVNGAVAQVSGSSFSITVSLDVGLNTISVIAGDNAGHITNSPSLTVLRNASSSSNSNNNSSPTALSNPSVTNTSNNTGSNTQGGSSGNEQGQTLAAENTTGNETNNKSQEKQTPGQLAITPNGSVSTPVKVAIGAGTMSILGLGIASFLGYIPYKKFGLIIAKLFTRTS